MAALGVRLQSYYTGKNMQVRETRRRRNSGDDRTRISPRIAQNAPKVPPKRKTRGSAKRSNDERSGLASVQRDRQSRDPEKAGSPQQVHARTQKCAQLLRKDLGKSESLGRTQERHSTKKKRTINVPSERERERARPSHVVLMAAIQVEETDEQRWAKMPPRLRTRDQKRALHNRTAVERGLHLFPLFTSMDEWTLKCLRCKRDVAVSAARLPSIENASVSCFLPPCRTVWSSTTRKWTVPRFFHIMVFRLLSVPLSCLATTESQSMLNVILTPKCVRRPDLHQFGMCAWTRLV